MPNGKESVSVAIRGEWVMDEGLGRSTGKDLSVACLRVMVAMRNRETQAPIMISRVHSESRRVRPHPVARGLSSGLELTEHKRPGTDTGSAGRPGVDTGWLAVPVSSPCTTFCEGGNQRPTCLCRRAERAAFRLYSEKARDRPSVPEGGRYSHQPAVSGDAVEAE